MKNRSRKDTQESKKLELEEFEREVDEYLTKLQNFHTNSNSSMEIYKNLDNPMSEIEARLIEKSAIVHDIKYLLIKNMTLELAKAYNHSNSNDHFSIPKLMRLLDDNPQHVRSMQNLEFVRMDLLIHKPQIQNILNLRNKLYGHSDEEFDVRTIELTKQDFYNLIDLLFLLIKKISSSAGSLDFLKNKNPRKLHLLEDLALGKKIRVEKANPLFRHK